MELLENPNVTTLVIRARYYGGHNYVASAPNQGIFRSAGCEQGFDRAAEMLLDRHFPGHGTAPAQIPHNDARVQALCVRPDRNDADAKEVRWYVAHVEIAD